MIEQFFRKWVPFETLWSEVWNLFKFGVVGLTSLALNEAIYALFSRALLVHAPRTLLSVLAVCISAVYNFALHRSWTFNARTFTPQMLGRYLIVLVIGMGISGILFYIGHEAFHLNDFAVQAGSAFLVAGVSYVLHRWYTFHPRHEAAASTNASL